MSTKDRSPGPAATPSRRRVIAFGGALAAGATAGLLGTRDRAGAHGTHFDSHDANPAIHGTNDFDSNADAILGQRTGPASSEGNGVSGLRSGEGGGHGVGANRSGSGFGQGVAGVREGDGNGSGVFGQRSGDGVGNGVTGVRLGTGAGAGVEGRSDAAQGVLGLIAGESIVGVLAVKGAIHGSSPNTGVYGLGPNVGVRGASPAIGVYGSSGPNGSGVIGETPGPAGVGVLARHIGNRVALKVEGRAQFSTVGVGTISAGESSATVADANVTAFSHITVTLTSDPGAASGNQTDASVKWVSRDATVGFTVHTTRPVSANTTFSYFIVEP